MRGPAEDYHGLKTLFSSFNFFSIFDLLDLLASCGFFSNCSDYGLIRLGISVYLLSFGFSLVVVSAAEHGLSSCGKTS